MPGCPHGDSLGGDGDVALVGDRDPATLPDPRGDALRGGMPLYKFAGNKLLTWYQNRVLRSRLSEFHTGYKAYTTAVLRRIPFELNSNVFHFDTEIIIQLLRARARINEIPIPTHYGDEENYVNIWDYGMKVLITTATYFFHKRKLRRSRNWSKILGD